MNLRTPLIAVMLTGLVILGHVFSIPPAYAAPASKSLHDLQMKIGETAKTGVIQAGRRGRRFRRYFRRPFMTLHFGRRYYDDDYYRYRHRYRRSYRGRCARWSRRCASNWGYGNDDYYGCLNYHGCR